jgi:hypothetical protein
MNPGIMKNTKLLKNLPMNYSQRLKNGNKRLLL